MFKALLSFAVVRLAALTSAQTISGQFDCMPAGDFTLCQNLWGECKYESLTMTLRKLMVCSCIVAGVGGQNSTLLSVNCPTVSWRTDWTWANGPNNVKSCEYDTVQVH